jgi:hypothetical protein
MSSFDFQAGIFKFSTLNLYNKLDNFTLFHVKSINEID